MKVAHAAEEIRILGRIPTKAPGAEGRQGPDGRREDMPPAILGSAYQPFSKAAAAGRSAFPDDAGQGPFPLAFQIGQSQQSH